MKQHILRLIIVIVVALGVGLTVYFVTRDNTTFNVDVFVREEINKNEDTYNKIISLSDKVNNDFLNNKTIYDSLNESVKYYSNFLTNINLNQRDRNNIRKQYENFDKCYSELKTSLNSLESYLNETNQNETELNGRKEKVVLDFENLNKSFVSVNIVVEKIVFNKVFDKKYLDATFAITSGKNLLIKCYINNKTKYATVSGVIKKVSDLKANNYNVTEDAVKFAISYNEDYKGAEDIFTKYLLDQNIDDNFLINFLTSGDFYEKI